MSKGLIKITGAQPSPLPTNWVLAAEGVYLSAPMPSSLPPGASVILEYQEDGLVVQADEEEYLAIRPLGNDPSGAATGTLRVIHFMGDPPPMLGDRMSADPIERIYPADNLPLEIVIGHYWYEQAEFSGWGFLAEIVGGAASRDPSVRAMAVYSDPAHTQYLWTGGAFQQGPSRLGQVDAQGQPLTVWFSDTPAGFRTQTQVAWNLAVLWASVQEGTCVLAPGASLRLQFWEHRQGYEAPPSATWVDTGATVAQLVGAGVYRLSATVTGLTIGQAVRLGDAPAGETVFNGYWPTSGTPSDYVTITPHVTAAVGAEVYKWA